MKWLTRRERQLTWHWSSDHLRREGVRGCEDAIIRQWPINKLLNESALFNRKRLNRQKNGAR